MRLSLFKPNAPPPIILEEKETRALAARQIEKMDFTPPEFRDWRESIKRMTEIRAGLLSALRDKAEQKYEFLPSWALWLAFGAAVKTIETINSDHLNCAVPWDTKTGFPSLPSMTADARKYGENLKNGHKPIALILDSFCAWTRISRGRSECCCAQPDFKFETVEYDVVINHGLSAKDGEVIVAQLVGIQTDDVDHLKTHFSSSASETCSNFQKFSRVLQNTNILWTAKNTLKLSGDTITIGESSIESAREFSRSDFYEVFMQAVQSAPL